MSLWTILTIATGRTELLRLAGLVEAAGRRPEMPALVTVLAGAPSEGELAAPLPLTPAHDLTALRSGERNGLAAIIAGIESLVSETVPDLVLIQGDHEPALAAALVAGMRSIPLARIDTGPREFRAPDVLRRKLIHQLADLQLAGAPNDVERLMIDGVPVDRIVEVGDPVLDIVGARARREAVSAGTAALAERLSGQKLILLSTRVPLPLGGGLPQGLPVLRDFLERTAEAVLVWPVEPDPYLRAAIRDAVTSHPRVILIEPLPYPDLLYLTRQAWVLLADSWSPEAEATGLGRPMLVLSGGPDGLAWPAGILAGIPPRPLGSALEALSRPGGGIPSRLPDRPSGGAGPRILSALGALLARSKALGRVAA